MDAGPKLLGGRAAGMHPSTAMALRWRQTPIISTVGLGSSSKSSYPFGWPTAGATADVAGALHMAATIALPLAAAAAGRPAVLRRAALPLFTVLGGAAVR